ncbi:Inner membrane mitoribosome receptor MBA1, mitochondrial [Nakaseomyces bracarensis]|uniref:Inner membrane mitoribosome receptor MBA1, mitochondrial n=1 Tax=Nakaseomyces bracarensis TaxID=273131 RepID=A0ABR4P105_9SACH
MLSIRRVAGRVGRVGRVGPGLGSGLVGGRRLLWESRRCLEEQKNDTKKIQDFNPRHLGVASELYVPAAWSSLPSVLTSPRVVFNAVVRRLYILGLNTVQVGIFRFQTGIKPQFLLWKNKAIETYVQINKGFASKSVAALRPEVSIWVEEALQARSKQVPDNVKLDWQLLKFNEVPKLISLQPMMIPGRPLEHIQLLYRFNTKQRLVKLDKRTNQVDKLDRDVVDYMVFLCDATTNDLLLMGSVFESEPGSKMPKNYDDNTEKAVKRMKECGDIYRVPPTPDHPQIT